MISEVILENVRKKGELTFTFPNSPKVYLKGRNGSGKSSICEGLCFALTGRDSAGGPVPTHLISNDATGMRVTVSFKDGSKISRTLTRKKNSTLSLSRYNLPELKLSQQALMEVLGYSGVPLELYLSCTIAGYFMRQPSAKRFAMLSMVMPKLDRIQYLSEKSGFRPEAIKEKCGDMSDKIPSWYNFANYRQGLQRQRATLLGRISEIERSNEPVPKPVKPLACELLPIAEEYMSKVDSYMRDVQIYNHHINQHEYALNINAGQEKEREKIKKDLEELPPQEKLFFIEDSKLKSLRESYVTLPQEPAMMRLPSSDFCPSCGQAVGSSLRERIRTENEKKIEVYNHHKEVAENINRDIGNKIREEEKRIEDLKNKNKKISEDNYKNQVLKTEWSRRLLELVPMAVPAKPEAPVAPKCPQILEENGIGPYKKDILALQKEIDQYNKMLGVYERYYENNEDNVNIRNTLVEQVSNLDSVIDMYAKLEDALRDLPKDEVAAQSTHLTIENYSLDFTEGFDIFAQNGAPYDCLSSGEKISLDVILCEKLQSFLMVPIGWCFVDNADLLHDLQLIQTKTPLQMIFALARNLSAYEGVLVESSLKDSPSSVKLPYIIE